MLAVLKGFCNFATVKVTEKFNSWLSKANNLWSNNQGAASIYAKGYSTSCVYCYTVAGYLWSVQGFQLQLSDD